MLDWGLLEDSYTWPPSIRVSSRIYPNMPGFYWCLEALPMWSSITVKWIIVRVDYIVWIQNYWVSKVLSQCNIIDWLHHVRAHIVMDSLKPGSPIWKTASRIQFQNVPTHISGSWDKKIQRLAGKYFPYFVQSVIIHVYPGLIMNY